MEPQGPKRVIINPGRTLEERKAAIIAMFEALTGKVPSEQGLKDIEEVLSRGDLDGQPADAEK